MFRLVGIIASLAGLVAVDNINRGIRWGAGVFGFLKAWRQNFRERRQERRARKRGQALPAEIEGDSMFPKGTQTLTGIAVLVLAPWAAKYGIESAAVEAWVAAVGTVVGGIIAVLGYLRRKKLPAE